MARSALAVRNGVLGASMIWRAAKGVPIATIASAAESEESGMSNITLLIVSTFLVLLGGVFAGLTIGLMGLDVVNLEVMSEAGEAAVRKDAARVLGLLNKGKHWVLVVLLLSNVVVNESLPIFLDKVIGGGVGAIFISTTMIVIFGEILPQSVSARYGLTIGAKATPFVLALMYLEYPIAYPIAKLLDYMLGESHGTVYKKAELKAFVGLHRHMGDDLLSQDEVTIVSGVLELSEKPLSSIMTPIEDVFTLSLDDVLDRTLVDKILRLGHSRIPIYETNRPDNYVGMLIVKTLIAYDPDDAHPVKKFPLSVLPETDPRASCLDALNYFQQGRSHILLISKTPGQDQGAMGVVTLEDVIEEMIGEEIVDETDVYVDIHKKVQVIRNQRRSAPSKSLSHQMQGAIDRRRNYKNELAASGAKDVPQQSYNSPTITPTALAGSPTHGASPAVHFDDAASEAPPFSLDTADHDKYVRVFEKPTSRLAYGTMRSYPTSRVRRQERHRSKHVDYSESSPLLNNNH